MSRAIDGDKIVKILNECIDKILAIQNLDITYNPKLSAELQVYKDMLEDINEMPTIEPEPQIIYSKAGYIMSLHKEYGCTLTRAEEAHNKALEYLRDKAMMKG